MMASFKDYKGTTWVVRIVVGDLDRIKTDAGIDLGGIVSNGDSVRNLLKADPGAFVRILYVLCEEQIKEAKLSPEEFARRFDAETRWAASDALLEALVNDFSPRPEVAQATWAGVKRGLDAMAKTMADKATEIIGQKVSVLSATDWADSSASIPAP